MLQEKNNSADTLRRRLRQTGWDLLLAVLMTGGSLVPLLQIWGSLTPGLLGCIVGLAFGSMLAVQLLKAIRTHLHGAE